MINHNTTNNFMFKYFMSLSYPRTKKRRTEASLTFKQNKFYFLQWFR